MHLTVHHLVQVKTQLQHTLPVTTNHATKLDTVAAASASSAAIVIAIVIAIVSAIVSAIADSIVTAGSIASLTISFPCHVDREVLLGTALRAPRARHHHTIDYRDYGRVVEASKVHLDS